MATTGHRLRQQARRASPFRSITARQFGSGPFLTLTTEFPPAEAEQGEAWSWTAQLTNDTLSSVSFDVIVTLTGGGLASRVQLGRNNDHTLQAGESKLITVDVPAGETSDIAAGDYTTELLASIGGVLYTLKDVSLTLTEATQDFNDPPVPKFSASTSGMTIAVDASNSVDPDGQIVAYDWTFTHQATQRTRSASGQTASVTVNNEGSWRLQLVVTDDAGATEAALATVDVFADGGGDTADGGGGGDGGIIDDGDGTQESVSSSTLLLGGAALVAFVALRGGALGGSGAGGGR